MWVLVAEAAELTPHGFRHVLVSAGAQLRRQGFVDTRGLGTLGHWTPGSIEPEKYDSFSGVSELDTRNVIWGAFREGWAPAQEGELSTHFAPRGASPPLCGADPMVLTSLFGHALSPTPRAPGPYAPRTRPPKPARKPYPLARMANMGP